MEQQENGVPETPNASRTQLNLTESTDPAQIGKIVAENVARVIVGKRDVVELLLVCLLCEGHVLIEDVPGVGKTMLARALARSVSGDFRRIQFTPDLLPSDISGISFFDQKQGDFRFRAGPVFANVVLADEINRATPRTQSALLEAMEEHTVSVDGETMALPRPFIVLATENPVELEGTFPLPEAQLDRFLMQIKLGYPTEDEELEILSRHRAGQPIDQVLPVVDRQQLIAAAARCRAVAVDPDIARYLTAIVRATRTHDAVALGASPRAGIALYRASQALAAIRGRDFVIPDDVQALLLPVLGHRLLLSAEANLRGRAVRQVLDEIRRTLPVPVEGTIGLEPTGAKP